MHYAFLGYTLYLWLVSGVPPAIFPSAIDEEVTVIIEEGSRLTINGSTNVNTFSCHYEGKIARDTMNIRVQPQAAGTLQLRYAKLSVEVARFDCGHRVMNKDFRKLLDYEQHPRLKLAIQRLQMTDDRDASCQVRAKVRFTVAGEEKTYDVPVRVTTEADNGPVYQGEQCLDITDFKLTPPKKFLGMVVVDEEVAIEFHLNLRIL